MPLVPSNSSSISLLHKSTSTEKVLVRAMAGLYKALKPYDERVARNYLREAEAAYQQLESRQYEEGFDRIWIFYGTSVLYNATGNGVYHNAFESYLKDEQERNLFAAGGKEEQIFKDEAYIYGVVAYLTKNPA